MPRYEGSSSVTIDASPATVFTYLLDFQRHPEWVANLSKVTLVDGKKTDVGARYRASEGPPPAGKLPQAKSMVFFIAGLVTGSRPYSESVVTAVDPERRIAWSASLPRRKGDFNRADWEMLLEPEGRGTRLTQRFCYMPQNRTANGMVSSLGGVIGLEQACSVSLQRLKDILEKRAAD